MMGRGWEKALGALLRGEVGAAVITGGIGAGKTELAGEIARLLVEKGHPVGGVLSPRILSGGTTIGYRVRDLISGAERTLCSLGPPGVRSRRFHFVPEAVEFARRAILRAGEGARVVVVDEVGPWELRGGGFAPALWEVARTGKPLVLTVRPRLVGEVCSWLGLGRVELLRP